MVKPKGKTSKKRAQKSSKTKTTRADGEAKKNKKLVQEIDKSQQLLRLVRTRKSPSTKAKRSIKVDEFVAGCNKKMPSLSVLEQKYEDSDSDEEKTVISNKPTEQKDNPSTPIISPVTLKKYADKYLQIINNFEAPPPVIPMKKQPKSEVPYIDGCKDRPKVPETRSVNFCKGEADYGISSKTNGLNVEQDCLNTQGCHVNVYSLSKSNFNSQANEIASKLILTDNIECIDSDSDDTVVYEINSPKARFSPRPSTSKDNETITKNDQNFNESFMNNKFHAYIDIQTASCRPESKINAPVNEATVKFSPISNNLDDIEIFENTFETVSNIKDEVLDIDSAKNRNNNGYNKFKGNPQNIIEQPFAMVVSNENVEIKQNENNVSHINVDINKTKTVVEIRNSVADYNTEVLHVEGDTIELKDNNEVNVNITKDNFISIYDDKETTIHDTLDVSKISPINTDNSTTMNTEYSTFDPTIMSVIDLTNIDDLILENKAVIDKYSKHNFKTVNFKVVESKDMKNQTVQSINSHQSNTNCNYNPDILEETSFSRSNEGRTANTVFNNPEMENMPYQPSTVKNPTSMKDKCTNNMDFTMYENSTLNPIITAVIDLSKMGMESNKPINFPQSVSNSANTNSSSNMSSKPLLGTCPICLDNMSKETVGSTHCGHLFCMPCIKVALQKKRKHCPTCRKKLTGTGWHQIFI